MGDQTQASIVIDASPSSIMGVIADFPAYPQWVDMVKRADVLETGPDGRATTVRFVLDAGIVKDEYVLAYDWDDDRRVTWHLLESRALRAQDGSYTFADAGGSTEVTYELAVELKLRVLGAFKRKAETVIIDTALRGLKARVESRG